MSKTMTKKLYAHRNILKQGQHYCDHVSAMTGEHLYDKSDIAAELAHRDIVIENITKRLPCTHDGVPILWGDTVYYVNEDSTPYSNDRVLSGVVDCISTDMSFTCYKGTHNIQTSDYEAGNLEFYSNKDLVPQD